ncbi:MAG: cytochrome c [Planctomycetota bacterium]
MEVALQERLSPMIGSERALSRGAEDAAHEAQVLAALAEVITREGFADADDEDYTAISHRLRAAAADLARAAEEENYEPARTGLGAVGQSCVACHEDYRG